MAAKKSSKPSKLKITRKKGKFTAEWNIPSGGYDDGQQFEYKYSQSKNSKSWTKVNIGNKTTKKTFLSLSESNYYPSTGKSLTLNSVSFHVRGNKKGSDTKMSEWAPETFEIKTPKVPQVTVEKTSELSTKFSWSVDNAGNDSKYWFVDVEYQISQKQNNASPTWGASVISDKASSSYSHTIDSVTLGTKSYTIWFRIRSRGPKGPSAWSTIKKRVYANPNVATISEGITLANVNSNGQLSLNVYYNTWTTSTRPTDSVSLNYLFAKPDPNFAIPSGSSFTKIEGNYTDTKDGAFISRVLPSAPPLDQCVWVRVDNTYCGVTTPGRPALLFIYGDRATRVGTAAKPATGGLYGKLEKPTIESVVPTNEPGATTVTINVTNNSQVADSRVILTYHTDVFPKGYDIGYLEHNETEIIVDTEVPFSNFKRAWFTARAVVSANANGIQIARKSSSNNQQAVYVIDPRMESDVSESSGDIPLAPAELSLDKTDVEGTISVMWKWTWNDADGIELSWADHADAWESTDEPSTYTITKARTSKWNISGLSVGSTWYVRARYIQGSGDDLSYGTYCDIKSIDLLTSPNIPSLTLSEYTTTINGSVTAAWGFSSNDGTTQKYAEIDEIIVETVEGQETTTYVPRIKVDDGSQHVVINANDPNFGWDVGEHTLVLKVQSTSGLYSDDWSLPVILTIAEPLTISMTVSNYVLTTDIEVVPDKAYYQLVNGAYVLIETVDPSVNPSEEGWYALEAVEPETATIDEETLTFNALKTIPFTVTVNTADINNEMSVSIIRAARSIALRPDETEYEGYAEETIYTNVQSANNVFNIMKEELYGSLDDGDPYQIIATVKDELGQFAKTEPYEFRVRWDRQAFEPIGTVRIDEDNTNAIITPTGYATYDNDERTEHIGPAAEGDRCDIYRLSSDRPELVYRDAEFGSSYVDPYPAIGESGGYRIVYKTIYDDYTTANDEYAWTDIYDDQFYSLYNIIDFGNDRATLIWNVDLSSSWSKDFQETQYLGGSVIGDWNPAISRTGSVNGVVVTATDQNEIEALRRLANYAGICHVRTVDGSSYNADVQVSENRGHEPSDLTTSFSLSITRVDPEDVEGRPYESVYPEGATGATGETQGE